MSQPSTTPQPTPASVSAAFSLSASDLEKRPRISEEGGFGFGGGVGVGARLVAGASGHASWRTPRAEALAQHGHRDPDPDRREGFVTGPAPDRA
jgi:hypothetical protein